MRNEGMRCCLIFKRTRNVS